MRVISANMVRITRPRRGTSSSMPSSRSMAMA
jgi:hypothetical protein